MMACEQVMEMFLSSGLPQKKAIPRLPEGVPFEKAAVLANTIMG